MTASQQNQKKHWAPHPKQSEALIRPEFEILYGGARGGGKTDTGQAWLLYDKDNPRYRALVIRKNAGDLNDWVSRAKVMFAPTKATFTVNPYQIVFPSGATIVLGHLKDDNAYEKYQGHEYHKILIEELTQIPNEKAYLQLISSCRTSNPTLTPQVFCTTNPGGRGHKWVKQRWNISGIPKKPIITRDPESNLSRIFIPARVDDNPSIMENDPSYVLKLEALPDGLREAWREGSWEDVEIKGAYYAKMLLQASQEGRIGTYGYNPEHPVHTVWDIGMHDSTAVGFFQRYDNKLFLIDYYENNNEGLQHYIRILQTKPYIYGKHFAPHDIMQKEQTTGKTRLEGARKLGINFEVVPKMGLDDGINAGRVAFSRLHINKAPCEDFTEAVRQYRKDWDEKNMCYKPYPLHDWTSHAADMYRYAAISENDMVAEDENFWQQPEYEPLYGDVNI